MSRPVVPRRPGRSRLRRRLLVAIAFGVIATYVSGTIAMMLPAGHAWQGPPAIESVGLTRIDAEPPIWQVDRGRHPFHAVVRFWHLQVSGHSLWISAGDYDARAFDLDTLPRHARPDALTDLKMTAWYHETGFPLRGLTCSVHWKTQVRNADIIYTVRDGIQLPRDADFNPRAIPLRPLWPAFAIDVLAWGGSWLLLAAALRGVHARRRARRGGCTRCGYPRTGLPPGAPCPECGAGMGPGPR